MQVQIQINESKKVYSDYSAFISSSYDEQLVKAIRECPERYWHSNSKVWEVAIKHLENLIPILQKHEMTIEGINIVEETKSNIQLPEGFNFKTEPFNHQIEGLVFGLNNDRFLLGDEQGLGKTKQVIDIAVAKRVSLGYKHCLIICGVNGLKWNWRAEIATHSSETSYLIGQKINSRGKLVIGSTKAKLADLNNLPNDYFLIINVESLRDTEITNRIKELCDSKEIEMVAIDEIHKCKNPVSQQGKAILKVQPLTRIAITGTPLMNTPLDLYIVLKWLGYEKHSFFQFKVHHCVMGGFGGYEIVGYKNLEQIRTRLDEMMLRRLKRDVLDLPEKIRSIEYVEMSSKQATLYNEIRQMTLQMIDKIAVSPNPLAQLIRLRQATGYTGILSNEVQESAKLDRLEEIIEELVANNEKCIVFSNWTDMTEPTYQRLQKYNPAIITGQTRNREEEKERFMNDDNCKVIIGTIGAMGTGLTLTAASTVVFLDSPWNRANKEQAEDRAHRIGTKSNVNIITLVCRDTIDERIEQIIAEKGDMADELIDNIPVQDRRALLQYLLD